MLHVAIKQGDHSQIHHLLQDSLVISEIDARNEFGLTPLHTVCKSGKHELLQLLINNGADIEAHDADNMTPLKVFQIHLYLSFVKLSMM
jgi:ankyrin repeat protein